MSNTAKRKTFTSDDLMRRLEGEETNRKRMKIGAEEEYGQESVLEGSDSAEEEDFRSLEAHLKKQSNQNSGFEEVLNDSESFYSNSDEENSVDKERLNSGVKHYMNSMSEPSLSRMKVTTRHSECTEATTVTKEYLNFASFGIYTSLVSSMNTMSIRKPTSVQAACIPPLLAGRDCIGNAKTGSGKTIAFALPILQKLAQDPYGIFALILTPTRELAFQIGDQFTVLGAPLSLRTAIIVGGMDMMTQAIELGKHPHVVIATPGRIVDLLRSSNGEWDFSRIRFLVLDEADRLLTETFSNDLAYLFEVVPRDRQTGLFTATLTPAIEAVGMAPPRPGKQKPFIYRMESAVETVETLKQNYLLVPSHVREPYLYYLLCHPPEAVIHLRRAPPEPVKFSRKNKGTQKQKPEAKKQKSSEGEDFEQPPPTIIFCRRAYTAAYLTVVLQELSVRATALHSRLTQRERLNSLSLFRAYVVPVLVCTDIAARGLDIEDVAMVINWDLPDEPEEYTHRVGRTARRGRGGVAVSFVTERDEERVTKIEGRINTKLEEMTLPEEKVLEKLNAVSTAKRLANMELYDSDFGKRERIHKMKQVKLEKRDKAKR